MAVCTGNICRSPAMERLLAQTFSAEPEVTVISAGTYAHVGEDMQPQMKRRIADYGSDVNDFVAEQATVEMIEGSELILAATQVHLDDMLAEVPAAGERSFTLPQFGRLLQHLSADEAAEVADPSTPVIDRLAALVPMVAQARREQTQPGEEDEVVDPYMLPESVFDESFRQIREPIEALSRTLKLGN
ncbi:hypothetical protein [Garicola koreensis]|uniref:Protein-tyrosine phosphatase n=1 Tax=Garicola koreensis TaxID=1262554 RepID=A0A7W5XLB9_9MICC|nr:hypothetical protein [Garicola koreensis]MBB3667940.1 protein-tyrosine phosphatase [Garicola koreensis]